MPQHNIDNLEKQLKTLDAHFKKLADDQTIAEMLKIIRKPGYTTPAEFKLTTGIVESLSAQVEVLIRLRQNLVEGSRLITAKALGSTAGT
jgi:hypothetical protein